MTIISFIAIDFVAIYYITKNRYRDRPNIYIYTCALLICYAGISLDYIKWYKKKIYLKLQGTKVFMPNLIHKTRAQNETKSSKTLEETPKIKQNIFYTVIISLLLI